MNRVDRQGIRLNAWLKRTGFNFGNMRSGGAQIPESAREHMRKKPYCSYGSEISKTHGVECGR